MNGLHLPLMIAVFAALCSASALAVPDFVEHNPSTAVYGEPAGVTMREEEVPLEDETVSLRIRIGCSLWYTDVAVYYTIDGSEPAGAYGVPGGSTSVLRSSAGQVTFVRNEPNSLSNIDWWRATLPDDRYDTTFERSLLATALRIDEKGGGVIAGMHNGAYPFVWPRDAVYAAKHVPVEFMRTFTDEMNRFAGWLGRPGAYAFAEYCGGGAWNRASTDWVNQAGTALFDFHLAGNIRDVMLEYKSFSDLWNNITYLQTAYGTDSQGGPNSNWQVSAAT